MIEDVTGIILAGGRSLRMGKDKSFILFFGRPMIENILNKLLFLFTDLAIISNRPYRYRKYRVRIERDIIKGCGPLGGIYTALVTSRNFYSFITACDMPFLNLELIRYMTKHINRYDVVIPYWNGLQPLCAIYSKNCIEPIERSLQKEVLKITDFFKHMKMKIIPQREVKIFDACGLSFENINSPEDYNRLRYGRI